MKNVVTPARRARGLVLAAVGALLLGLLPWSMTPAAADTAPSDPSIPATVAADPLPTVQINGVAWAQKVIGNTVYVAGNFTSARPAGSAAGQNETPRANLLAYDIRTGNLITSWAPTTNGEVNTITSSPDGKRIYIGGVFTSVNGQTRSRIAALDPTTGATVQAFQARTDGRVRAIAATQDTVYIGGLLTQINGVTRSRVGAVRASDGAVLSWSANPQGGSVHVLTMTPAGDQLLIGGNFTTMNGSSNPGYGLASLSPTTGELLPWAGNGLIRNGGANAAITGITTDGDSAYVSGFVFGSGGNLEGVSRMNLDGGAIRWVEDCHGDTYGTYPKGDVIYVASHAHYCGNLPDGFPQTEPWTQHYGTAFTKATTGVLGRDPLGYYNYEGTPAPTLLKWIPLLMNGTFTGQGQAGWNIVGNSDYVAIGGEFPRAGNQPQQGLVRYAVRAIAPNKVGPELSQSKFNPTLSSFVRGTVRVAWQANWDRDNENLTYQVIRDGDTANPIYQTTLASSEWKRPAMGYTDTGLVPGRSYRYRVFAKDPLGNEVRSDTVTITASSDGEVSPYAQRVLDDGAGSFWRLGEDSGAAVNDWAGFKDATAAGGVARGAEGAIASDTNKASTFDGSQNGSVSSNTSETAPNTFTTESWVKTTSTSGGKILGFGGSQTGTSGSYDRHVYMSNDGRITFGVYPNTVRTVSSSAGYNDGRWHQVVTSLGPDGMQLWIDGRRVAARADTTNGQAFDGYWRIGGDNTGGWPGQPSSNFLAGTIDDVSVYPTVLSGAKIRAHYVGSGRDLPGAVAPADAYGKAVYDADPDLYWRLSDDGSTAADASPNQNLGSFDGGVTRGGGSGVGVSGDSSVELNGSNGAVASNGTFSNPTTYSQELWFKTTTRDGGKLIGFGSSQFGGSGSYDRHVYMLNDGRLRFGTWTGQVNLAESTASYNDGAWHQMVATQSSDGMKLYVDGQVVGTNPQTSAQDYSGHWRVGGDNHWGDANSRYFAGSIDEVSVYSRALSANTVKDHFVKGGGQFPNVKPSAAFTSSPSSRTVDFDATGSTDEDGTISSYSWSFGDGETGTGKTPQHTYTADGTYTVQLTVTDDRGGQDVVSHPVTVTRTNLKPQAAFTSSVSDLSAAFDATGSKDDDGTISSYRWDFGDGSTGTGLTSQHTYGSARTYQVTLTVTDNDGATDQITKDVTVTPANVKPTAGFTSSVSDLAASFNASSSKDDDGTVASYRWDFGDGTTGTGVTATHTYGAARTYQVTLTVTDDDGATDQITKDVTTTAPPAARTVAADTFSRSATGGWGTADTGGAWTARSGTPTSFAVDGNAGTTKLTAAGKGTRMTLGSVSGRNLDSVVDLKLDKDPAGGGGFFTVANRVQGTSEYRGKVKVNPNGTLALYVTRVVNGTETTLQSVNLPTTTRLLAGETIRLRLETTGNGSTVVRAKAWKPGTTEPTTWQVSATDTTAALQTPGSVALDSYISATSTNVPIVASWDDLKVVETR